MEEKLKAWRARLGGARPRAWRAHAGSEHLLPAAVLVLLLALAAGIHLGGRGSGTATTAVPGGEEAATDSSAGMTPASASRPLSPAGPPQATARPLPLGDKKVQAFQSRIASLRAELTDAVAIASRMSAGFEESGAMIPRKVVLEYTELIGRIDRLRGEIQRLERRRDDYVAKAGRR
jgi:hypothetical protein